MRLVGDVVAAEVVFYDVGGGVIFVEFAAGESGLQYLHGHA